MTEEFEFKVDGFIPEPDSDRHWSYEDLLKDKMTLQVTGDVDLRSYSTPRHNQRRTNSCVANSVVKALEIKRVMQHGGHDKHVDLSRMAVYYLARELMFPPQTHVDKGTFISHACDALRRFGACPETDWPWDEAKINTPPTWAAMRHMYLGKIDSFYKIRSIKERRCEEVVRCLQAGNPVVYGTTVGTNWFTYQKGQVLGIPDQIRGRHATVLVGYRDGKFIGENSWGPYWGDDGFYLMEPEVIACPDSSDFWVIQAGWEAYGA